MALHPVELTPDARQDVVDLFLGPRDQVDLLIKINGSLSRMPRGHTPVGGGTKPRYAMREHGVTVIYEVADENPTSKNPGADDAPGATVSVLNVLKSRGRELDQMARQRRL